MPNYYPPASGGAGGGGTPDDNTVTSAKIVDGAIVNADINAAAAIAYSKLSLGTSIVNADVSASAAIAYSKLNLASSIVTGDITDGTILGGDLSSTIAIPSAATLTTQTTGNSSTKGATTAFVQATAAAGECCLWTDGTFTPFPLATVSGSGSTTGATNQGRTLRFICPKTGTLANLAIGVVTTSGNIDVGIYDTNDAAAGSRTKLWTAGSTACSGNNTYQSFTPGISVTAGVSYDFALSADNNTAAFLKSTGLPNIAFGTPPVAFNVVAGAATAKQYGIIASQFPLSTTTIAEASVTTSAYGFFFWAKIT